ncbi:MULTISPECIES: PolC-type DNA polymerase III [unclassified Halobacteriovorax]|uniref:3'-5' exonuclease n=1 Tax=unclassified Halobacteriovorax TaxID=2639665 RepID=UPI0039994E18
METHSSKKMLADMSFCVFDLETTGGNQKKDKIIEIGLVQIDNLEVGAQKSFLINPERKIPDFIQKLTSITQDEVEGAPIIDAVIDEVLEFIGDRVLIAHNSSFDIPFLNSVLERLGRKQLENKGLCTNLMTKYLIPTLMNSNLNYMSRIFNISHQKAHRALDDAIATAQLFLNYLNIFIEKDIKKINHLYYPKNRYELDLCNFKKDTSEHEEIVAKMKKIFAPFVITVKGQNGVILFSFPCTNKDNEIQFISERIKDLEWQTISIKLSGPILEALIRFNHSFNKMDEADQEEAITMLRQNLIGDGTKEELNAEYKEELQKIKQADFVLMNHLVPEQFTIYPLGALGIRQGLIFRYPGHDKKLIQYINSKSNRKKAQKLKEIHFPEMLQELVNLYMAKNLRQERELMIFKDSFALKNKDFFFTQLDKFIEVNPNKYNYPEAFI